MPSGLLNVPHFKQEFNHSCVAACVRMVLAFHGHNLPEADLRQLLNTKSSGTPARNLTAVASLGFLVQLSPSNLALLGAAVTTGLPPIVFLDTGVLDYWQVDCAHVAVVVGIEDTSVYLNDPFFDTAPQQTSLATFQQAWASNGHFAAIIQPRP
jgi:ABC-type bacteriocin/lantibiotic exporter with double-glycine peptidase domain